MSHHPAPSPEEAFYLFAALAVVAALCFGALLFVLAGGADRRRGGQRRVPNAPRPPMATRIPDPPPAPRRDR